MTIRNLDYLFKPKSIAVIGASKRTKSVGAVLSHNLLNAGFDGPVMPVNPKEASIESTLAYNSVAGLPMAPDLAVICTPPPTVPGLVAELSARGTRGIVVVTAGFGEGGSAQGKALMQKLLNAAQPTITRIVGPNCLGIMVPRLGINASFSHINPLPGNLAFVTQSGAVATAIVDWATNRNIGFSHVISLGDMGDVDFGDLLDYLAMDPNTRGILMYIESVTDARKFMSAGRAAARAKPVIVIKSGRNEAAAKAAASHTGALAGSDEVYDAAFRRAGMLRVFDLDELFDAVETLAMGLKIRGDRLAIVTNGGGIGVLATESLVDAGGAVADIAPETVDRLNGVLPPTWSHGNPVDIIGDATGKRYSDALDIVLEDPNQDAVLVLNCPAAVADSLEAAHALTDNLKKKGKVPVLTSWVGDGAARRARKMFAANKIPTYETPNKAARALMHMVNYKRNQELLLQTPPSILDDFRPDIDRAKSLINTALDADRVWLTEPEAKAVLDAYGIPVVATRSVATPDEAADAAEDIGKPVALKILSTDLTHKSDIGGVRLNLLTPDAVREAADAMLDTVAHMAPHAKIDGFTVQEMAHMPGAHELIVGIADDSLFGPILLFGQGGTAVEVIADKAISLPPLNLVLAYEMMRRTRVWKLLQGYRSRPQADLDAIAMTLVKLSQLVCDLTSVVELDINPLFASEKGVLALDARIKVRHVKDALSHRHLAIRPYPKKLEQSVTLRDGRSFLLRPIRPEDEPLIQDMLAHSTEDDIRLRFFTPLKQLTHEVAARMSQIDYHREMGLVAEGPTPPGESPVGPGTPNGKSLFGVVRISADPDNEKAEYAVMVRSDMKGLGLGYLLMSEIIDYARERGIQQVFGEVLRENTTMLKMCEELGFKRTNDPDDPGVVQVEVKLSDLKQPITPISEVAE